MANRPEVLKKPKEKFEIYKYFLQLIVYNVDVCYLNMMKR